MELWNEETRTFFPSILKPKRPPNTSTEYMVEEKKNIVCWGMLLFTLFHFTATFHEHCVEWVVAEWWNGLRKIVGSKLFTELCCELTMWSEISSLLVVVHFLFRLFSLTLLLIPHFFHPTHFFLLSSWELSFCGLNWISTQKKMYGMKYMIKYSKFTAV